MWIAVTGPAHGATVIVDPTIQNQYFEGWGTSLCWWAVLAGGWSEANRTKLISAIVDPDSGLGYNCFRYNIGGGDQPGHTHLKGGAAVPGFKPSETGPYDWTADQNQRNIVLGIAALGKDLIFEAFSNSPPWWMTVSGCSSGHIVVVAGDNGDNLKPTYFTAFADYLTEVVKHYRDVWGITFRTLEPFNEPSPGWWPAFGTQEGCGFANDQPRMVKELGKQLVAKGLFPTTSVSAADESWINQAVYTLQSYDDSAFSYMSQCNTHSYGGFESRNAFFTLASQHGKNLWQSECGPYYMPAGSEVTMYMSQCIIGDLRDMRCNAWIDWQVCDVSNNWKSINVNQTAQSFTFTKRFYMHSAFSRFIRPGSRIIASSDTNTVAALVPATGNLVVIMRNGGTNDISYTFDLSRFTRLTGTANVYQFLVSQPLTLFRQPDVAIANKQFSFTCPAQSITSFVVPGVVDVVQTQPLSGRQQRPSRVISAYVTTSNGTLIIPPVLAGKSVSISVYSSAGRLLAAATTQKAVIDMRREFGMSGNIYIVKMKQAVTLKKFSERVEP
jgi:O-glycosyl hydrolase